MNKYVFQLQRLGLSPQESIEALREMELVVETGYELNLVHEAIWHYESLLPVFGRREQCLAA